MSRPAALWLPVAGWMAVLFFASSLPGSRVPTLIPDWVGHGVGYLVLGGLVSRALAGGWGRPLPDAPAGAALAVCLVYAASDELHQVFVPGRNPSLGDLAVDVLGAVVAVWAWRAFGAARRRPAR